MTGHGDKVCSQRSQFHRQHPRRLCRIDDKRHTVAAAEACHFLHRQNIAEYIGAMGEHRSGNTLFQRLFKFFQGVFPIKKFYEMTGVLPQTDEFISSMSYHAFEALYAGWLNWNTESKDECGVCSMYQEQIKKVKTEV